MTNGPETRAEILRKRAARLSQAENIEPAVTDRVMIFKVAGEHYGLRIDCASEVFTPDLITPVPGSRPEIVGITNLRGEIVTVISLAGMLDPEAGPSDAGSHIIVAVVDEATAGLLIDDIVGIYDIPADSIDPPLNTIAGKRAEYIVGECAWQDGLVGILDAAAILGSDSDE